MFRPCTLFVVLGLLAGCAGSTSRGANSAKLSALGAAGTQVASSDSPDGVNIERQLPAVALVAREPEYPEQEQLTGIEGRVQVRYVVAADGSVTRVRAVGPAAFRAKALEAISSWRFQPATIDGRPRPSQRRTQFIFRVRA